MKRNIQDLIKNHTIKVGGLQFTSNSDHTIHKNPLQDHGSHNASTSGSQNQANFARVKYDYSSGPIINNIRTEDGYINTITVKRAPQCNATTRSGKVTIAGPPPARQVKITIPGPSAKQSQPASYAKQPKPVPTPQKWKPKSQFNLIDQLGKTPAQIYILEFLRISPAHKDILDKTMLESLVPKDIDVNQFETMVGYLTTPHHVTFSNQDYSSPKTNHNDALHIETFVHKHKVRRILVDGGVGLNICSLKLVKALGFSDACVDPTKSIVIKAYDDEERSSRGVISLPIRVGLVIVDTTC